MHKQSLGPTVFFVFVKFVFLATVLTWLLRLRVSASGKALRDSFIVKDAIVISDLIWWLGWAAVEARRGLS